MQRLTTLLYTCLVAPLGNKHPLPGLLRLLPLQVYGVSVVRIDKELQQAALSDGRVLQYDHLISTIPLDETLRWLGKQEWAQQLQHSSSHIIGVGIRGKW